MFPDFVADPESTVHTDPKLFPTLFGLPRIPDHVVVLLLEDYNQADPAAINTSVGECLADVTVYCFSKGTITPELWSQIESQVQEAGTKNTVPFREECFLCENEAAVAWYRTTDHDILVAGDFGGSDLMEDLLVRSLGTRVPEQTWHQTFESPAERLKPYFQAGI